MKVKLKALAPEALCVFRKGSKVWLSVRQVWKLSRPGVKEHAFQERASKGEEHSYIYCSSTQFQGVTSMYHSRYAYMCVIAGSTL
jgi:hypothetical protein